MLNSYTIVNIDMLLLTYLPTSYISNEKEKKLGTFLLVVRNRAILFNLGSLFLAQRTKLLFQHA